MSRGGYTPSEILGMEAEDLLFLDHYQTLLERERLKDLATILGCRWSAEDLARMAENKDSKGEEPLTSDAIFIPLAQAINPELSEYLIKKGKTVSKQGGSSAYIGGGTSQVEKNAVVKSMGEIAKEDFLRMVGGIGGRRA